MRRARFYLTLLALTLLPQLVSAADLCRYLSDHGVRWLSFSVPGVLFLLNVPMAFEVLRRKRRVRLPRIVAALVQTTWTAFWLGSVFYAILLFFWALGGLVTDFGSMPVWLALAPFALAAYGTLFVSRVLRRERVEVPVAGLPRGWWGARIVQLSDLHSGRHVTAQRLRGIARRAARLSPEVLVVTGDIVHNSHDFARQAAEAIATVKATHGTYAILGNHDFWAGADAVEHALENEGI